MEKTLHYKEAYNSSYFQMSKSNSDDLLPPISTNWLSYILKKMKAIYVKIDGLED